MLVRPQRHHVAESDHGGVAREPIPLAHGAMRRFPHGVDLDGVALSLPTNHVRLQGFAKHLAYAVAEAQARRSRRWPLLRVLAPQLHHLPVAASLRGALVLRTLPRFLVHRMEDLLDPLAVSRFGAGARRFRV